MRAATSPHSKTIATGSTSVGPTITPRPATSSARTAIVSIRSSDGRPDMSMHRTLITGIGGFAGRHLADYLRFRPDVELLGLGTAATTNVPFARYFCCDLTDARAVQHTIDEARPDVVYHLAARTGGAPERMHDVNVRGFVN